MKTLDSRSSGAEALSDGMRSLLDGPLTHPEADLCSQGMNRT